MMLGEIVGLGSIGMDSVVPVLNGCFCRGGFQTRPF